MQGMSILARRQQPQHVLAFLQVLLPIAGAAASVARQALPEMRQLADGVQQRWDLQQVKRQEAEAAMAAGCGAAAANQQEIHRYFQRRLAQQQDARADPSKEIEGGCPPNWACIALAAACTYSFHL